MDNADVIVGILVGLWMLHSAYHVRCLTRSLESAYHELRLTKIAASDPTSGRIQSQAEKAQGDLISKLRNEHELLKAARKRETEPVVKPRYTQKMSPIDALRTQGEPNS